MSAPLHDLLAGIDRDLAGVRLVPAASIRALGRRRRRRSRAVAVIGAVAVIALSGTAAIREFDRAGAPAQAGAVSDGCPAPPPVNPRASTIVWLTRNSTAAQRSAIEQRLATVRGYVSVTFETRAQAWTRFTAQECDAPEILAATKPEDLPESLWVVTRDRTGSEAIRSAVAGMPGVGNVLPVPATVLPTPGG